MISRLKSYNPLPSAFLSIILCLIFVDLAGATQVHPPEEGEYVHQIGHIFFIGSMGILIYWLRHRHLTKDKGWRCIQYSALFFILWNFDAIVVHYIEDQDDIFEFINAGQWDKWIHSVGSHKGLSILYYFGRMDHLLCVPAILLLYFGLKHLLKQADAGGALGKQP